VRVLVLPMTLAMGALPAWKGLIYATNPVAFDPYLQPRALSDASRVKPLPAKAEDFARELAGSGLKPEASVRDLEGKPMPTVVVSVHALGTDAAILCVLRDPVGQQELVGADGVVHMVDDPKGGRPIEAASLDVSSFAGRHFFDMRRRVELQPEGGRLRLDLPAGQAVPVAALPYGAPVLTVDVTRKDDRLKVAASEKVTLPHVVRMAVVDKSTGKEDPRLSRNLLLQAGRVEVEIPLAVEERARPLEVRLTDILTGASATK